MKCMGSKCQFTYNFIKYEMHWHYGSEIQFTLQLLKVRQDEVLFMAGQNSVQFHVKSEYFTFFLLLKKKRHIKRSADGYVYSVQALVNGRTEFICLLG